MTAWWEGEGADPETGYSHLWRAGCCIVFLIAYEPRGKGHDDQPRGVEHGPDQTSPGGLIAERGRMSTGLGAALLNRNDRLQEIAEAPKLKNP
jgi:hypothetical protein